MMQAIAMSLAVEEEGALPPEEKQPEEPQPEIEYVTEDKLWSLYDKILGKSTDKSILRILCYVKTSGEV